MIVGRAKKESRERAGEEREEGGGKEGRTSPQERQVANTLAILDACCH